MVYSYDEALLASTEYFNGNELAANVFVNKYALWDVDQNILEKTPDQMHRRIAKEFARIEAKKFKVPFTEDEIFDMLDGFQNIIPQGSPMAGIGNTSQIISLSNCFVIPSPLDSYGAICRADQELVQLSKRRCGVGVDLSNLRPAGASTQNAARTTTGIVTFAGRYSNTIREVGQAGRRGALMLSLSILHPQALDFATMKNDTTQVTGANISLRIIDEFMNAVVNNTDITLRWPVESLNPKVTKVVNALEAWKTIIHSAWLRAEPGLLFWDNITRMSPADCYELFKTVSTNPCAELPLAESDACRLLLYNLMGCVRKAFEEGASFDYKKFYAWAKKCQRLMDDLVDLEIEKMQAIIQKIKDDPEPADIKKVELDLWKRALWTCENGRRTGTGITALGDTIAALGIKYGSDESIKVTEKIYRTLKLACYESSVDMAEELGAFPVWNHELEKNNEFLLRIKEEDPELYARMKKHGRRNISLLTTAPAGSVSIVAKLVTRYGTSSGIEPEWTDGAFIRKKKVNPNDKDTRTDSVDQSGDHWQHFSVYPNAVEEYREISGDKDLKNSPFAGATAEVLDWKQRVRLQAAAQRHVDHSIASTINLPETATEEQISEIYIEAWKAGCKGITVYRDKCRTGVLVKEDQVAIKKGVPITTAPTRPDEVKCEVHHLTIKGHRYYAVVGLLDGDPYECFTGNNQDNEGDTIIPKSVTAGVVAKVRSQYRLQVGDKEYPLTRGHNDPNADALTRMVSTSLRHGAPIEFVVEQLGKTEGDLHAFAKVLGRTLKKYIPDAELAGETMDGCETPTQCKVVYSEGCKMCKTCGRGKCG